MYNFNKEKDMYRKRYSDRNLKQIKKIKAGENLITYPRDIKGLTYNEFAFYEKLLFKLAKKEKKILEIGCGAGEASEPLLKDGANVILTDVVPESLEITSLRFKKYDSHLRIMYADAEDLPFKDKEFDLIVSIGLHSYVDHSKAKNEIDRVLKSKGIYICMDTMDHNPIYRLNRYSNYLRGERNWLELTRTPNMNFINSYKNIGEVKVFYFGSMIWLINLFKKFISMDKLIKLSERIDKHFANFTNAFHFIMVLKKK